MSWTVLVQIFTSWIPNMFVPGKSFEAKNAWREKFMLCIIIFLISLMILNYLIVLPSMLCPVGNLMSAEELSKISKFTPHIIVHGKIYDFTEFAQKHSSKNSLPHHIYEYSGKDASFLFPRPIKSNVINKYRQYVAAEYEDEDKNTFEPYFHSPQDLTVATSWLPCYDLCRSWDEIKSASTSDHAWIVIDGKIYDITELRKDINLPDLDSEILTVARNENFTRLIDAPWGRDKSEFFRYPEANEHYEMLLKGYEIGVVDFRKSWQCKASNFIMLFSTGIIVLVLLVKFFASMQLGFKKIPEKLDRYVLILIPCFSEDKQCLKASIDSVSNLDYDSKKKVLVLISDGYVIGKGNNAPTPELLMNLLGITRSYKSFAYESISSDGNSMNRAEIYFGQYNNQSTCLPFILIIKVGSFKDPADLGNRGKRDSQLILIKFLSKIFYNQPLCPLEIELYQGILQSLNIDPNIIEFILMIDADTEVFPDALTGLIACCIHDSKTIGICGETRIKNEKATWITMIQVYEYFISHHMSKSFESLFGCVTCLPGCFCLYRLKNTSKNQPLLIQKELIDEYSRSDITTLHQKNLLTLGEDRYLTTLALKFFPKHRTKFTPDAVCLTIVPETWPVLLSQRRRWINSTVHNLLELLRLSNLCGFCLFSMRFIIIMDLFSTIILPSTVIYLVYLIFKVAQDVFPAKMSMIMIGSVYGLQALVFILRGQLRHVGWMIAYILSLPIFGFFIPIYSFWNFDDFSWGRTRNVSDHGHLNCNSEEVGTFALKTWDEHKAEIEI